MAQLAGEHPDRQRQVPAQPGDLADRGIAGARSRAGPPAGPAAAAASPGGRVSRLITAASSSAVSRRRLVTSTRLPAVPGSSGRTCSCPAASSSSSRIFLPATWSRHRAARASRPGGICAAATPAVSSRLASASAGSTGRWPGVWACSGRKNCPSGKLPASRCAACTAKVVLPIPAIPSIAWMPTTPPPAASAVQRPQQPVELGLAAGEAGDIPRQRPGRRRRERPRAVLLAGRQHVLGRAPPAGRRDEQLAHRPGQAQRTGQQHRGVLAGGAVDAPLQVTDRPRAQPRRLRQLLLRQPGLGPQLPQQPCETQPRLLRHRPTPLPTRPRPSPDETHAQSVRRPSPASTGQTRVSRGSRHDVRADQSIHVGRCVGHHVW